MLEKILLKHLRLLLNQTCPNGQKLNRLAAQLFHKQHKLKWPLHVRLAKFTDNGTETEMRETAPLLDIVIHSCHRPRVAFVLMFAKVRASLLVKSGWLLPQ